MLNLTPERRRHHLRMRQLDKARRKASRKYWWKNWKGRWKQEYISAKGEWKRECNSEKLHRSMLPTSKLEQFIFPTKAILVEKNRNATIRKDVFVEFNKHGNIERVIGVDENIDYTYLLDDPKYGASLVEPLTEHVIANSRVVEPVTGNVFRNPFLVSFWVRTFKILMFFIVSEAIFPILWAYHFFKSYEIWGEDESGDLGFLWFSWQFLKLGLYPFLLVYYIMKDCRDIQADTSWWSLIKRLFE